MNTLQLLLNEIKSIPANVTWYLADISEAKGKQDLYIKQSPQRLKILREHALIQSAVSSNRIEGVEINKDRIGTVIFGKPLLQDRNEEEIRGYRDALSWIHENHSEIKITENTLSKLHTLTRGDIWDAGEYKNKDSDIIERLPNGETLIRFKTVPATETKELMSRSIHLYNDCITTRKIHPVIASIAFNFDFLCIHPFRDGNGRISRLLLLLMLYHHGFQVGKYISLEKLIEENKERYYETLKASSQGWYEQKHDYWIYINFILYIIKSAYTAFSNRLQETPQFAGSKSDFIRTQIGSFPGDFSLSELFDTCPGVSKDLVRKVVKDLQKKGVIESLGRGPGAKWRKKGNTLK